MSLNILRTYCSYKNTQCFGCIFTLHEDHYSERKKQKETMVLAILSLVPMAYWHEPRQSGTNNTWRAVQRQLGSVVRAGPINEWACGRGRGRGTAPTYVDAWESMHSDRSSPSPVLAWYKLIPACSHVVLQKQQRQHRGKKRKKTYTHKGKKKSWNDQCHGRSVSAESQQGKKRGVVCVGRTHCNDLLCRLLVQKTCLLVRLKR